MFLLNSIYDAKTVWNHLNCDVQRAIIEKKLRFYVIDAYEVAKKTGMGGRINTVMQTCYFAVSGVLPREEAIEKIKAAIEKTYSKKGRQVVEKNFAAVDASVENCHEVEVPASVTADCGFPKTVADEAPDFVKRVTAVMMREQGDKLPVSAFPVDGTWPSATTQWEKRNIAIEIPGWNPELCIQCTKCATICPHAAIRAKFYKNSELENAPEGFKHAAFRSKDNPDCSFTIQVAPEDCTGCGLCATVCPGKSRTEEGVKALMMVAQEPIREREAENFKFFLKLPNPDRSKLTDSVKDVQFRQPLFEFSGSCAGCGEPPTSRCSPSSSATGYTSQTPPAAPRFTAATSPQPPIASTNSAGGPHGRTRSLRTTRNSASVTGFPSTRRRKWPPKCSSRWLPSSATIS